MPVVNCDLGLNGRGLVEFSLNLVGQFLDDGNIFLEAFDLHVFLEHFDEALEDELLEELVVDFGIRDFSGQG